MDDREIEDILANAEIQKKKKNKKVNSGEKGKRTERNLGKLLQDRFGFEFTRTTGSGNKWGQCTFVALPQHAKDTYAGDLICPENFEWVIECKGGYNDTSLYTLIVRGREHQIDQWIEDAIKDGERSNRKPIICWKKDRMPWLAMASMTDLWHHMAFSNKMIYTRPNGCCWVIVPLADVLALDDYIFFKKKNAPG